MNENPEQQTAEDVLRSSELTARLLRRLTASPGMIDLRMPQRNHARLLALPARAVSLYDELMTRYGLDDGSAESQSLVMEQPWLLNVNAYLTNNNSFSSTI